MSRRRGTANESYSFKKKIFLIQKWEASLFPMAREHKREVIQVCQVKVDGCLVFRDKF
jgi:hypothetical protein